MKKYFYLFILPFFLLIYTTDVKASHIMGGDITYRCLGGDVIEITLAAYRDCDGITMPTSASIRIEGCNAFTNVTAPQVGVQSGIDITPVCPFFKSTPCNPIPGQPIMVPAGSEQYIYRVTIDLSTLPPALKNCPELVFSWTTCCRNSALTNALPNSSTFYAKYKKTLAPCNNSPKFLNDPIPFLCGGDQFNFNHGAYDPDGDSLSFSLTSCKDNNINTNLTYRPGYSATNPVTTLNGITIDPLTGTLSFTPTQAEFDVICVKIDEFRNGVKIGEYIRDLQFVILPPTSCTNPAPTLSGINGLPKFDTTICPGQNLCFDVYSQDINPFQGINLKWNQSLPGATFTVTKTGSIYKGTLCWTPPAATQGIFHVSISAQDDGCPLVATTSKGYIVEVFNPVVSAGPDKTICPDGDSVKMALSARVNFNQFTWTPSTGLSNPNIADPKAKPSVTTTYTVTATNGYCTATDEITVIREATPPVSVSNDVTICPGDSSQLVATSVPNAKFKWSPKFGLSSDTISNPWAKPGGPMTYIVRAESPAGCRSYDSVKVDISTPASIDAGNNTSVCIGSSIELNATTAQTVTYDWEPKATIVGASNIANPEVNPTIDTWYFVTVTDQQGCVSKDSIYVTVNPLPVVDAGPTVTIPEGGSTTLMASPTGTYTYEWNPGGGTDANFTVSPTAESTVYTLTVTDFNGCTGEDTVSVLMYIAKLVMPNAFSPNGDGVNERFNFVDLGPLDVEYFRIYNRWGELIYECSGTCTGWDGTYKGVPQPAGSYSFAIQSRPLVGEPKSFKGNFTLVR